MSDLKDLFIDQEAPAGRVVRAIAATGSVSATELVQLTGLARSTVSTALTDLRDRGIVLEGETRSTGFGRPTRLVSLNPNKGFCAGVLLGLNEIRIVVCDLAHTIMSDHSFEMNGDYTPDEAITQVQQELNLQCEKLCIAVADLLGVGFAVSAPVSYEGTVLNGSIMPTWSGLDIADVFAAALDCPIYAENESHCGALAEMTWGAAVGERSFVMFKFDRGVGGAVVIDGTVQRGAYGNAAEFGHISLNPYGPLCRCGNRGCLETYAGGFNLARMAQQATGETVTVDSFVEGARNGNTAYVRMIEDAADMAGWGMGITSTILSPPVFIIAGKLASLGSMFLASLERSFARHAVRAPIHAPHIRRPRFAVAKYLSNDDTVLGAVALVLHQHGRVHPHSG